jgi:hypothetical protein
LFDGIRPDYYTQWQGNNTEILIFLLLHYIQWPMNYAMRLVVCYCITHKRGTKIYSRLLLHYSRANLMSCLALSLLGHQHEMHLLA